MPGGGGPVGGGPVGGGGGGGGPRRPLAGGWCLGVPGVRIHEPALQDEVPLRLLAATGAGLARRRLDMPRLREPQFQVAQGLCEHPLSNDGCQTRRLGLQPLRQPQFLEE